ncbi:hypothetical protein IAQ69_13465 [Acinetobacter variabilis]|uniref:Uncharacterized protein n=1 Tax=Acinetobacter variabilis TaxID=70346 RepID=A0A7T7WIU7_9GAMM|nr:hypothetical protein [Acinetobacter variabilis]QQN87832.1 hypothetical protein IAQ69_13465 [Acinetobacter variabilis]
MRKESYTYKGLNFEIKTISEDNPVENRDLVVAIKYNGKLLEFYHASSETVADFKTQNKTELENRLYEIAKMEVESKFFEMLSIT